MPLPNPSRLSPAPRPSTAVAAFSLAAIACLLFPTLAYAHAHTGAGSHDPTVSLSGPTYTLGNHEYDVTITFSESVTGFEKGDVTVGNASVSAFSGSGASYSIKIKPSASGAVTVEVAANVATDSDGNGNSAATRYSATADLDPPSVQITGPTVTQTGAFTVSVAFSEAVGVHGHPFERGDVTVGNGSVTGFSGSGASYSITVTPSATGTVTVKVAANVARDAGGNANTASGQFSVQANLNPPVITAPGDKTYEQGVAITAFGITTSDADRDAVTVTVTGLPSGLSYANGQVQGTVSASATAQAYTVTIRANDGVNTVTATFTITVTDPNAVPSRTIHTPSNQTYEQGATITAITVKVLPHSPQGVGETVTGLPSGLSFTQGAPGEISGTVAGDAAPGAYTVTITADSGAENEATATFTITVTASTPPANPPANSPPAISVPGNQTYQQGQTITAIDFKVTDADGDEVTVTVSGLPSGLAYTNALLQGTVSASATAQNYTVTVSADDGVNTAVTRTFTITVTAVTPPANSPPVITAPGGKTYYQGQAITAFGITVTDADSDQVTVTVSGLPSGLSYASGQVQGTVSASATAQAYTVTIGADDGVNTAVTATFTITVTASDTWQPEKTTVTISGPTGAQSGAFDVTITFTNPVTEFVKGDVTVGNGTVTAFSGSSASYTATITPAATGTVTVDVGADVAYDGADNGNAAASQYSVQANLNPPNTAPGISTPANQTYRQGQTITAIDFKVTDVDGDEVTVTVSGLPAGLAYTNALLQGTVSASATVQAYTVTVSANDGVNAAVTGTFTITVTASNPPPSNPPPSNPPANRPPGISVPGNKTYQQGETITAIDFKVTDVDGDEVTVTVSGLPSGLSYTNALVQGTVSASATVQNYTVTVSANDGVNSAVTGTFTITVTAATSTPPANRPPAITVPDNKTYQQGETITAIDFKVTDVDGDEVTVTVSGLPSGLSYTNALVQGTVSASATVQNYTVTVSADDGVNSAVTGTFTITVAEAVTVAIAGPADAQDGAFDVTITFSESVAGFAQSDVTVGNGSVTALSGSGASYTATITPAASGTVTVDVPADVATSAAGKGNEAASQLSVEVFLPRSIRFEGPTTVRTTEDSFSVRVTFSEMPAPGSFSSTRWHCEVVPTWYSGQPTANYRLTPGYTEPRGGTWPYTVKLQVEWRDPREGHPPLVATYQVNVDPDPPRLRKRLGITGPTTPQSGPFDVRLQVSEGDLVGFTKEDVTVVNGSVTSFVADSDYGRYYTVQITPAASGAVSVSVGAATFKDLAGWDNVASQVFSVQADLDAPTVAITGPAEGHDGAFDATITFSEDVTGFEQGDLTVGNGSVTAFSGSGSSYTATISPSASHETVTVDVVANAASDAAGNGNEAASQYSLQAHSRGESTVDLVAPTVTITGPTDTQGLPFEVTIEFSEDVTGFVQGDVTVGNGSVTEFSGSGASYAATILPTTKDGTVTVDVAADAATDDAGNGNEAAAQFSVTVSSGTTTPGRVNDGAAAAISGPTGMQASAFEVTITFTDAGQGIITLPEEAAVTGFEQEDLTIANGEVTAFSGSGASYSATLRPAASGAVRVDVPAGVALDSRGRGNRAARQYSVQADLNAPTVAIAGPAGVQAGAFDVTITFSEDVTGFDREDVTVGNGLVTAFSGAGAAYTSRITPTASGTVTVDVAANAATDGAGNGNEAADQYSAPADVDPPTVAITGPSATQIGAFEVTITFSEAVTGFETDDVTVGNGSVTGFSGSEATYRATIRPEANGAVTVDVADNAATDGAGNGNEAASRYSAQADLDAPTVAISGPTGVQTGPFDVAIAFSEAVTGFARGDVTVGNGSVTAFSGSGAGYEVEIWPDASGTVTADVAADAAVDGAGNGNEAASRYSVQANLDESNPVGARSVAENREPGEPVGAPLSATDPDGDALTYSLSGPHAISFAVDASTGQVQTLAVLDYERRSRYAVQVEVSDGRGGRSTLPVAIDVIDVEEPPLAPAAPEVTAASASSLTATWSAPENAGRPALTSYEVQYRVEGEGRFADAGFSGLGTTVDLAGLDPDTDYEVQVRARNHEGTGAWSPFGSGRTQINSGPIFGDDPPGGLNTPPGSSPRVERRIAENTSAGEPVGAPVSATDPDGDALTYALTGPDADSFALDAGSGQVQARAALDFETRSRYAVRVEVSDDRGGRASQAVTIVVTDVAEPPLAPDTPVVTPASSSSLTVAWTAPENAGRPALAAYEVQYRAAGESRFTEAGFDGPGATADLGGLDPDTAYEVQVRARNDEGTGPWSPSGSARTRINNGPVFGADPAPGAYSPGDLSDSSGPYQVERRVAENTAAGEPVGAPVSATDPDGDALTYALAGPDAASFAVDAGSGQVRTRAALNHENRSRYAIRVEVSDGLGGRASQPVTIVVTDVPEPPLTPGAPVVTSASLSSLTMTWTAPENAGRPALTSYEVQYRAAGAGRFTEAGLDGLGTTADLDGLAEDTAYEVRVRARNHEGTGPWSPLGSGRTPNNSRPVFDALARASNSPAFGGDTPGTSDPSFRIERVVAENTAAGEPVGEALSATDPDGDALTYALAGPDADAFALDATSGQVQTRAALDYETRSRYAVQVEVSDGRGGTSSLPVAIDVTDVPEPPLAPDAPTVASASLSSLTVTWTAPESTGRPALTSYEVQYRAAGQGLFTEAGFDGLGTTAELSGLDADTAYEVQVRARNDEGTGPWSAAGSGRTRINNGPAFGADMPGGTNAPGGMSGSSGLSSRIERRVAENTAAGEPVGAPVSATDPDGDALTYGLAGPDADSFAVDASSGQVRTRAVLDHETRSRYAVQVEVGDGRGGTASQPVTIIVTDVAEPPLAPGAPQVAASTLSSLTVTWTAPENAGRPALAAYEVQYRAAGQGPFTEASFDGPGTTAELSGLAADSDYEVRVRAVNDEGTGPWSATASGRTRINNGPVFGAGPSGGVDPSAGVGPRGGLSASSGPFYRIERRVAENTAAGEPVGAPLSATDPDGDVLTYALAGPDADSFAVDAGSGQVRTRAALDHETRSRYSVRIEVSDGRGGSAGQPVTIVVTDVAEPPLASDAPKVSSASLSSLTVTWTAPENAGRPALAAYEARYRATGQERFTDAGFDGLGTTAELNGLDANTDYEVQVRALNDEGAGPWSASGAGTTLASRDAALSLLEVSPGALSPAFDPGLTEYTLSLDNSAPGFTVRPITSHGGAALVYGYVAAGEAVSSPESGPSGEARSFELAAGANRLTITVTAQDDTTAQDYVLVVTRQENQPPRAPTLGAQQATAGASFNFQAPAFTDPDAERTGQTLRHRAALADGSALPEWLTFTASTRTFSGTPPGAAVLEIEVAATDDGTPPMSTAASFTLTVDQAAPVAVDDEVTVAEGATALVDVLANDSDFEGDPLTVELLEGPAHGTAAANDDGTVTYGHDGSETTRDQFRYRVNDGRADSETATVTIVLTGVNDAPAFEASGYTFELKENRDGSGEPVALGQVRASDPEGETVTYTLTEGDSARFAVGPAGGAITYRGPGEDAEATDSYRLAVAAADSRGGRASVAVTIRIGDIDEPGAVTLSSYAPLVGHRVTATFADPDAVTDVRWQWHSSEDGVVWEVIPGANSDRYTPAASNLGQLLCVSVIYLNSTGTGKRLGPSESLEVEVTSEATQGVSIDPADRARTFQLVLAAVGRQVAQNAIDAVSDRAAAGGRSHATLGGQSLEMGEGNAAQAAAGALGRFLAAHTQGHHASTLDPRLVQGSAGGPGVRLPSMHRLVSGSSFQLALGEGEAGPTEGGAPDAWTLWGRGDAGRFDGQPHGSFTMDGEVYSTYLGIDYRWTGETRPLAGLVFSHNRSEVGHNSALSGDGDMKIGLTSVHPYGRWSPRSGLDLWTLLGYGRGHSELVYDRRIDMAADLQMWMTALGARQELLSRNGFDLDARTDLFLTKLTAADVPEMPAAKTSKRLRLALEARRSWAVTPEAVLQPILELGARWDDGDAESGPGAELAGGLNYADTRHRLRVEARGHRLLVHRDSFEEWGASLTLRLASGGHRGLNVALAPAWGTASTTNRVDALWRGEPLTPPRGSGDSEDSWTPDRLNLACSYGLEYSAGLLLTPFGELGMQSAGSGRLRVGTRLVEAADPRTSGWRLELFGEQQAGAGRSSERRLGLQATLSH